MVKCKPSHGLSLRDKSKISLRASIEFLKASPPRCFSTSINREGVNLSIETENVPFFCFFFNSSDDKSQKGALETRKGRMTSDFKETAQRIRQGYDPNWPNDIKLKLYALYKQGTLGDVLESKKPWFYQVEEYAKWNAWNSERGRSKEASQASYSQFGKRFLSLLESYAGKPLPPNYKKRLGL